MDEKIYCYNGRRPSGVFRLGADDTGFNILVAGKVIRRKAAGYNKVRITRSGELKRYDYSLIKDVRISLCGPAGLFLTNPWSPTGVWSVTFDKGRKVEFSSSNWGRSADPDARYLDTPFLVFPFWLLRIGKTTETQSLQAAQTFEYLKRNPLPK